MGSAQLAKLEGLSEKRADKSRDSVDLSRNKLAQLDHARNELQTMTREYQATPEHGVMFTAKLLAHRRAFVTQLTEKLDALNLRRDEQQRILNEQVYELRDRTAQSAAIGSIQQAHLSSEKLNEARREQLQQDESFRGVGHSTHTDSEDYVDE